MKVMKMIAAATVFVATGSAFAQQTSEYVQFNDFVSTKTRAEVRAELEQAYAEGQFARNSEFVEFVNVPSTRSRAEVRNEALQAAKATRASVGS